MNVFLFFVFIVFFVAPLATWGAASITLMAVLGHMARANPPVRVTADSRLFVVPAS